MNYKVIWLDSMQLFMNMYILFIALLSLGIQLNSMLLYTQFKDWIQLMTFNAFIYISCIL